MSKRSKAKFTIIRRISETPMSQAEWEACQALLAKLIAKAIMAEYKEQHGEVGRDE